MLFFKRKKKKEEVQSEETIDASVVEPASPASEPEPSLNVSVVQDQAEEAPPEPVKNKPKGFFARIKQGLSRTSTQFAEGLGNLLLGKKAIDDELLEEIETQLLVADVGIEATTKVIDSLTAKVDRKQLADSGALYEALQQELLELLKPVEQPLEISSTHQPYVILVVGVNGVGKQRPLAS